MELLGRQVGDGRDISGGQDDTEPPEISADARRGPEQGETVVAALADQLGQFLHGLWSIGRVGREPLTAADPRPGIVLDPHGESLNEATIPVGDVCGTTMVRIPATERQERFLSDLARSLDDLAIDAGE